jgi:hypothetical protein
MQFFYSVAGIEAIRGIDLVCSSEHRMTLHLPLLTLLKHPCRHEDELRLLPV